jgi:putative transposase
MLNLIDEHTRECLAIHVRRRINSANLIDVLANAMIEHGIPEYIRSDNGPEFVAKELRKWLARTGAVTLYIEPGSPWENGYCESFNPKLRGEFLNGEILVQHRTATLFAGISAAASSGIANPSSLGAWRSGKQTTLSTSPQTRLRRRVN